MLKKLAPLKSLGTELFNQTAQPSQNIAFKAVFLKIAGLNELPRSRAARYPQGRLLF